MATYEPKFGGYAHKQTLSDMRNQNEEDIKDLTRLAGAAGNDATKVIILQCLVRAHKRSQHIDALFRMARGQEE